MKKGFTVVKLMVVMAVLSIISLAISQPLASIIRYQVDTQSEDNMRDNLQFLINKMQRELKTASEVNINNNEINFTDQDNTLVKYKLISDYIERNEIQFTDPTIFSVSDLRFIKNTTTGSITILVKAESLDGKDSVTMQTSVVPLNN